MSQCTRRTFLALSARMGVGALALTQLPGCGGAPVDGSVTPTNGTVQLTFAQFPNLQTVGTGVVVDAGGTLVVVIRTAEATAIGLSAICTHEGCTVQYVGGGTPIHCACHDSNFSATGTVVSGPARTSLRNYSATVATDGITVTLA
ncbi:MAG: (2Fe-2S)-binding protein [Myxococcales bacterium]|nr:(2Fe-2S)-binding protein [Myxococcales bacterium]